MDVQNRPPIEARRGRGILGEHPSGRHSPFVFTSD
jgi:hypothetical protein